MISKKTRAKQVMKPKTRRRLLLVGFLVVVGTTVAFSLVFVRKWQNNARREAERAQGIAAYESGDRSKALLHLGNYFKSQQAAKDDTEALLAYARTRSKFSEPDGRHFDEAVGFLQKYLQVKPDDDAVRLEMVKLCNRGGMLVEAKDEAQRLRPKDLSQATTAHLEALREEALAQLGMPAAPRADLEKLISRIIELDPANLRGYGMYLAMLDQTQRADQARLWAEGLLATNPNDPKMKLVAALARLMTSQSATNIAEAKRAVAESAGLALTSPSRTEPLTDPDFSSMLVRAFDDLKMYEHSLAVLRASQGIKGDPAIPAMLARRLWLDNLDSDVVTATQDMDAKDPETDSDEIAFRILSLKRLGREGEARPLIDVLAAREWDYRAKAWFSAIGAMDAKKSNDPTKLSESLSLIVKEQNPNEQVMWMWYGDALAAVGKNDEAREAWLRAARGTAMAGWTTPLVRTAESLLADGRAEEAAKIANEAAIAAPNRLLINAVWLEAHAVRIATGSLTPPSASDLMPRLQEMSEILASRSGAGVEELKQRLIPVRVMLLASMGKLEDAKSAMNAALTASPPPSADTLRRLAAISVREKLGMESAILDAASHTEGESPATLYSRAAALAVAGKPDEGLKILKAAADGERKKDPELRSALARYMEFIADPGATAMFVSLGDAYPEVLGVQILCLESSVTPQDRAFLDRTIARYRKLTNAGEVEDDSRIRLAKARTLLTGTPKQRDRDEAIAMLSALIGEHRDAPTTRLLLAQALLGSDTPDVPRAIQQLTEVVRLKPGDAKVGMQLATLLQTQGDYAKARDVLDQVMRSSSDDPGVVIEVSRLLVAQGDVPLAHKLLTTLTSQTAEGTPPLAWVRLAEAQLALNDEAGATASFESLLSVKDADPESLLAAAVFLQSKDRQPKADEAMTRLRAIPMSEAQRLVYDARFDIAGLKKPADAQAKLERAVTLDPKLEDAWLRLASMHFDRSDYPAVVAIGDRAKATLPNAARLGVIVAQAKRSIDGTEESSLRPVIEAAMKDPSSRGMIQILEAIERMRAQNQLSDPKALVKLAETFPTHLGLQVYVIERLAQLNPPDVRSAGDLALAASKRFPMTPVPARLAAGLFAAQDRWDIALEMGRQWQQRDPSKPAGADVVVAEAMVHQGQAAAAVQVLSPRIAAASKTPDDTVSIAVLHGYGRALVASGKESEARELWRPFLSLNSTYRVSLWLDTVVNQIKDATVAAAWIEECKPHLDPASMDEQLALVGALSAAASKSNESGRKKLLADAETVLVSMSEKPTATPMVFEVLAALRASSGDIAGAEAAYGKVIAKEPTRVSSLVGLARLAMDRKEYPKALEWADRAVKASPDHPESRQVLAVIHQKQGEGKLVAGDLPGAKASFTKAVEALRPAGLRSLSDPSSVALLALLCQQAEDYAGAVQAYDVLMAESLRPAQRALVQNNRAYVLLRRNAKGDLDNAMEAVDAALAVQDVPEIHDTRAWILLGSDQRVRAIDEFRKVLKASPESASALIGLADSLSQEPSPAMRREAGELLGKFDAAVKNGAVTTPDLIHVSNEVRKRLKE